MDESKELVTNLILAVCGLCDRTRDLAVSEIRDPVGIQPLREAAARVTEAMSTLREGWAAEDPPECLPADAIGDGKVESWLLLEDDPFDLP